MASNLQPHARPAPQLLYSVFNAADAVSAHGFYQASNLELMPRSPVTIFLPDRPATTAWRETRQRFNIRSP